MNAEWYYAKNKQKVGPVTKEELHELVRTGELTTTDMVWKQGMAKWQPVESVDGLLPISSPAVPPEPPPLPDSASTVKSVWWERLNRNKPAVLSAILTLALLSSCLCIPVVSFVTNALPGGMGGLLGVLYALFMVVVLIALIVAGLTALDATEVRPHSDVDFSWPVQERSALNVKLLGLRLGIAVSVVIGLAFLVSIVGALFCLPFFSLAFLIYFMAVRKGRLHARWVPVDEQAGWVEFVSGGIFRREDGMVGTFILLPNQKFIDLLTSSHLVDSWRILTWGVETLEIQDMTGKTRSFKKGKTLEEKKASMFHSERTDDLPGSWVPIDGSGKWVQFTKDGAIVFSDGGAGRYTVTGEEPNEIIRITMADGSTKEYRVMSISKAQLVIVEGSKASTYTRHTTKATAASPTSSEQDQVTSAEPPVEQESSGNSGGGNVLAGVWNWLRYWKCPKCGMRKVTKDSRYEEEGQKVKTDYVDNQQKVFTYGFWVETYWCEECGHAWENRRPTSGPA